MARKKSRVILDTNLFISFLINRDLCGIDKLLVSGKILLVFSDELLEELISVVERPKFKQWFSENDLVDLLSVLEQFSEHVMVFSDIKLCRDPKDNFLLNLAVDSKADFLLTGDKDLLVLGKVGDTNIMTVNDFLRL